MLTYVVHMFDSQVNCGRPFMGAASLRSGAAGAKGRARMPQLTKAHCIVNKGAPIIEARGGNMETDWERALLWCGLQGVCGDRTACGLQEGDRNTQLKQPLVQQA